LRDILYIMEVANRKIQHYFFLVLLLSAVVLMFFVVRPFITPLVLAFSLAIIFRPIYEKIVNTVRGKESIAALLTVLLIVLIVLIPLVLIGSLLFSEVRMLYINFATNTGSAGILNRLNDSLEYYLHGLSPQISLNVSQYAEQGLEWIVGHLDTFFSSFLRALLSVTIMIIAIFYLLRDGKKLREKYLLFSPLSDSYDETILEKLGATINSVIRGSLVIAVVQGIAGAVGVTLAGFSSPLIWGLATMIASLVPGLGTGLVIGPAIIYLFVIHDIQHAIILLVWQLCVVGLVDNFLSPYLIKRGLKLHPFFILLSVLGGIALFGPIGFILGPIVLAFLFALLEIYPRIIGTEEHA
jgi:predicted PurR-regulated permease PerM